MNHNYSMGNLAFFSCIKFIFPQSSSFYSFAEFRFEESYYYTTKLWAKELLCISSEV